MKQYAMGRGFDVEEETTLRDLGHRLSLLSLELAKLMADFTRYEIRQHINDLKEGL